MPDIDLTRVPTTPAATEAAALGWRYLTETLATTVPVTSLSQAAQVAAQLVSLAGDQAGEHLQLELRPTALLLRLASVSACTVTRRDLALAATLTGGLRDLGLTPTPLAGGGLSRSAQRIDLGIDALDIEAVKPFWRAVLGYVDLPNGDLADPLGQSLALWFQQMDVPRPQRNRLHLDVAVPEEEAQARVQAALRAGGTLVTDRFAPSWWVLADVEGNEVCVCTWQDRGE